MKKLKTNSVSAIKASNQPDNLNPTTSNETIATNHRTDSISDEVIPGDVMVHERHAQMHAHVSMHTHTHMHTHA